MCGRAFSEYDLHRHVSAGPRRSLLGWLRDLWRPRQPQVPEAEVVPFPAAVVAREAQEADRRGARAA
jgi:hypothetical protein